jgi:hypothetical protein
MAAIVSVVLCAFEEYNLNNLNQAFLLLMMNYNKVLEHDGSNLYEFPHMAKTRLERLGVLTLTLEAWRPLEEEDKVELVGVNDNETGYENNQDNGALD